MGQGAAELFRPGSTPVGDPNGMGVGPTLAAVEQMRELDGVIRIIVTGGEEPWSVAFKLGPGEIPPDPTTTLRVSQEDADKMQRGELAPMEAFMAGRIQLEGDLALLMQMQAIQMRMAALAAPEKA
jgi:hypothetical protein